MTEIEAIRKSLCSAFCEDVVVRARGDLLTVSIPMNARDGDGFTAYLSRVSAGWRISDAANTMMRLSYENDLNKLLTGSRAKLYSSILAESGLQEDDGELFLEVPADKLTYGLFTLGQGLTRIEDLALWTSSRIESTFFEDLHAALLTFLPAEKIEKDYLVPGLPGAENYPVDFCIHTGGRPLYLFGVNNQEKARLATIILQHLQQNDQRFESMAVCADFDAISQKDRHRLMIAANDIVPNVTDIKSIQQKIQHRLNG